MCTPKTSSACHTVCDIATLNSSHVFPCTWVWTRSTSAVNKLDGIPEIHSMRECLYWHTILPSSTHKMGWPVTASRIPHLWTKSFSNEGPWTFSSPQACWSRTRLAFTLNLVVTIESCLRNCKRCTCVWPCQDFVVMFMGRMRAFFWITSVRLREVRFVIGEDVVIDQYTFVRSHLSWDKHGTPPSMLIQLWPHMQAPK